MTRCSPVDVGVHGGLEWWRDYLAGPLVFFVGVAVTSVGVTVRELRSGLAWGIAAVLGGLAVPSCQTSDDMTKRTSP